MVENTRWFPIFLEKHGDLKAAYNVLPNRTKYTKNEIRVYDDGYCEIDVYDQFGNYRDTGYFSECDLPQILPYKWYKDNTGYLCTTIGKDKVRLHNYLFPNIPSDNIIDHKDSNKMNYQRNNLQPITQALNIAKSQRNKVGKSGIHGVIPNSCNGWTAFIEINKKRNTRNFKNKEDAILQRLIWEINNWRENSPQLNLIKEKYPRLMYAVHNKDIMINDDVELVKEILSRLKDSPFCPCRIEHTPDTKCPCKEFREQTTEGECHCGLFVKVKEVNRYEK